MGDRVRVLHLTKGLNVGGAEQLVALLAQRGDQDRFDYAVAYALAGLDELAQPLRDAGVAVHPLGAAGQYDLRWVGRLRRLLREGRFDVLHVHLPYTAGLGRVAAWSLGARRPRVVHTQHNIWGDTEWPTRLLSRLTWWMDDADLAVSRAAKEALPPRLARRTEIVLHGIDLDRASPRRDRAVVRRELGVEADDVMVVTVANMRPEKGYDVLLEAAAQVLTDGLPVRFVAVGHGPIEGEVRAHHRRLGLGDRFVLTGLRRDVPEILGAADVFVLASRTEGFPVSVMEAFAAGLPVVGTRVGDLPHTVRHNVDGLLVPTGNPTALADAIRLVVSDPGRRTRMTAAAGEAAGRFDIRAAAARLEQLYLDLLARPASAPSPKSR